AVERPSEPRVKHTILNLQIVGPQRDTHMIRHGRILLLGDAIAEVFPFALLEVSPRFPADEPPWKRVTPERVTDEEVIAAVVPPALLLHVVEDEARGRERSRVVVFSGLGWVQLRRNEPTRVLRPRTAELRVAMPREVIDSQHLAARRVDDVHVI